LTLKQILPSSTTKMTKDSAKNNYVCWSPTESTEGFSEGLVRRFTSPVSPKIGLTFVLFVVEVVFWDKRHWIEITFFGSFGTPVANEALDDLKLQ